RNRCEAKRRLNLLLEPLVDFSSDPRDEARLNHDAFLYCGSELFDAPGQAHAGPSPGGGCSSALTFGLRLHGHRHASSPLNRRSSAYAAAISAENTPM